MRHSNTTFTAIACNLKACVCTKQVKVIHHHIVRKWIEPNAVIRCALIHIYAKLGGFQEARSVFDRSAPHQDIAMWNALISGYAEHGHGLLALDLFQQMQEQGFVPSKVSFLIACKVCSMKGVVGQGRLLHDQIVRGGLQLDVTIGSALIDMYGKCGELADGLRVFEQLSSKNVVSWGAMMAGYVQHGLGKPALDLFTRMLQEGIKPTEVVFSCIVKACACAGDLDQGMVVHDQIRKSGLSSDVIIGNALVDMYAKCGNLVEARKVFDEMPCRTEVSWGTIMTGYVQHGHFFLALQFFSKMQHAGQKANTVIFSCTLKACSGVGFPTLGTIIHGQIVENGLETDTVVGNSLIGMYCSFGDSLTAYKVFSSLLKRNLGSWEEMIAGYAKAGHFFHALALFKNSQEQSIGISEVVLSCILKACGGLGALVEGRRIHEQVIKRDFMPNVVVANSLVDMYLKCGSLEEARNTFEKSSCRDEISWNTIIGGCIQAGHGLSAVDLFQKMLREANSKPDRVTFLSLLKACQNLGAIAQGRFIHKQIVVNDLIQDTEVGSLLVDMYGSCGNLEDARRVFDKLPDHDVVAWSALIGGYIQHSFWGLARQCLQDMRQEGHSPDATTFTIILANCCQTGHVEDGYALFKSMKEVHGITPNIEHFNCMIDLFSRAGRLHEAVQLLQTMPNLPFIEGWMSLLAACKTHGETVLGRECFDRLLHIDPDNSAAYTLMLQIYADAHMTEDFHKIEDLRKSANAWKKPASAWIQMSDKLHEFVVGDRDCPHFENMEARLKAVAQQVKKRGYVPELDLVIKKMLIEGEEESMAEDTKKTTMALGFLNPVEGTTVRLIQASKMSIFGNVHVKFLSSFERKQIIMKDSIFSEVGKVVVHQ